MKGLLRWLPAALGVALALNAAAVIAADADRAPTIGDLTRAPPASVHADASAQTDDARAMDNYRRFLRLQRTDPNLRAEAMRRLGDLNQEVGQLDQLDTDLSRSDLMSAEAIRLYSLLLKLYPDYPRNDQVLYQLARAYETTGQPQQALATLDTLALRYPHNPMMDEVQFRRGELLFSARDYKRAAAAYESIIRHGPASSFYQQSLYKEGWALFKQSLNEESLPAFAGVLDQTLLGGRGAGAGPAAATAVQAHPQAAGSGAGIVGGMRPGGAGIVGGMRPGGAGMIPLEQLSRPNRELVEDTLRVMSITFSYLDGARSVDAFVSARADPPYSYLLYSRLGDLYVDKQRYQDAASAYRAFVAREPDDPNAPGLAMQAIEAYRKGGFTDLVLQGKQEYVERYDFKAPFWQGRARSVYPLVVGELKTNLKDLATYFHATAEKTGNAADYEQAARWYRTYLESFPDEPDSAATDYLLADALFASRQYAQAVTEYEHTAYGYPRNAKSATAAYAALVSYQKGEEQRSGPDKDAWHRRYVDAEVKFAQAFPGYPDSAGVLTRAAEDLYAAHDLARARQAAQRLLARDPPADIPRQRIAWSVVGQCDFEQGAFGQAEDAFVKARALAAGDAGVSADLSERIAAAVYEQGEARQKAGDASGAADEFLRVAKVAPDSKITATSQYDAAAQLITLKQWDRAVAVLENYRRQYPASGRAEDVTRKLAVAYAAAGRPREAAVEFERIAADAGEQATVRHEALTRAAALYEQAHELPKATAMLEGLVAQYPTPVPQAIEVREHLAQIAADQHDPARQRRWLREIIRADAQAGEARTDRTRYLAATAQLQLAAPARDAFRAIHLVAPLKRSLAAKRKALEQALAAYKSALDYHVAEVTTAATFEMAQLYRDLGKDVLDSERPRNLSKDELEQYESLLEDQAFPFEEQAIQLHEVNAARAREGVYDEWVKKSYAALAELDPGRYGKTELTQDVVATLE